MALTQAWYAWKAINLVANLEFGRRTGGAWLLLYACHFGVRIEQTLVHVAMSEI